jgi:hypothetical protein
MTLPSQRQLLPVGCMIPQRNSPISFLRVPDRPRNAARRRQLYSLYAPESLIIPRHHSPQLPQCANTLSTHNRALQYKYRRSSTASSVALIFSVLVRVQAMPRFLLNGKASQMLLYYFCGGHRPKRLPVPRGPRTLQKVYIPERRVVLTFVLFHSSHFPTSTRTIP